MNTFEITLLCLFSAALGGYLVHLPWAKYHKDVTDGLKVDLSAAMKRINEILTTK